MAERKRRSSILFEVGNYVQLPKAQGGYCEPHAVALQIACSGHADQRTRAATGIVVDHRAV
jgi:hypothetical protein